MNLKLFNDLADWRCARQCGEGDWWGGHGHMYEMHKDGDHWVLTTDGHCCAWTNATTAEHSSHLLKATAVSPEGKTVVSPLGTLSADGCWITWSERWAPWRKQAPEAEWLALLLS